ncbi:MAG: helix-turn-helix domain-containing protein [bacterium]|nr:helix-turn-helix domain-containing protein [bacterium]
MQFDDFLKQLDLSEKEIEVYLACLELGESSIVSIKEKTGLPRTTVFHELENLRDRGLIEITQTATRRIYIPYPPRKIMTLIRGKQEKLQEQAENLEKFLPEFNRLYEFSPFQPRVRFFRGEEIKAIYEEILETPVDEIYYVGETNKLTDILDKNFFIDWVARKVKKGIWTRSVWVRGKIDSFFDPKEGLRKRRIGPVGFECPAHYYIYGDNVAILTSIKENFGVVITSRENATAMRNWFQQLWKVSQVQ